MEFWGVEVLAGKSVKVKPDFETLIHVSQASLDKGKKGETALLYVTVDGKKLVMGTLSQGNIPQISFDLVFEKEFELSHSLESGSVHFVGYKSPNMPEDEEDFSDSEEEEEEAAVPAAVTVKADSKPKATKPAEEVKPESDEDDDDDDEDDSEEDGSDSEKGMDVDSEDDSEDEEEDDSEEEDDTPKKPEVVSNKKRPNESAASKTPISAKKAKPATPHPAKKGGKSPVNANQSPKSGGQSPSGAGANKKQFNSGKQFGSNNKGKGKGKGRA